MNELAKWAWIVLLSILFLGKWVLAIIVVDIVIFALVVWLKPKWIDKL